MNEVNQTLASGRDLGPDYDPTMQDDAGMEPYADFIAQHEADVAAGSEDLDPADIGEEVATLDPRIQTEYPHEPLFEDGAFHIELVGPAWGVYDGFEGKVRLQYATISEAIDAALQLSEAATISADELDETYARLVVEARNSLGAGGVE